MKVRAWALAAAMTVFLPAAVVTVATTVPAWAAGADRTYPQDQVMGRADAPITIVEYASTTCGHCANFHKTVLPEIKKNWIDTGKARLIYRDFPTGPAGLSLGASMVAHCAGPERYFGVIGLVMEQQDKWMMAKDPLDALKKTVRLAGITGEDVDACLRRSDLLEGLQTRAEAANRDFGVDSTPSFLVNGKLVVGAQSYEEMNKILQKAMP